jgi:hypothetical protein
MANFVASGITFNTTNGSKAVTLTPALGTLIVIITAHTANTSATAPTDNNSAGAGTYTQVAACAAVKATSADQMRVWIRDSFINSETSTIFTHSPGTTSGGGLCVITVSGMGRSGAAAALQGSKQDNQALGGTPTPVLGSAALTDNVMIGAVFNATNPAGMTARSSPAYSEQRDVGYNSPATGLEVMTLDAGETATSIAWGGTSASAFCSTILELDSSPPQNIKVATWPPDAGILNPSLDASFDHDSRMF